MWVPRNLKVQVHICVSFSELSIFFFFLSHFNLQDLRETCDYNNHKEQLWSLHMVLVALAAGNDLWRRIWIECVLSVPVMKLLVLVTNIYFLVHDCRNYFLSFCNCKFGNLWEKRKDVFGSNEINVTVFFHRKKKKGKYFIHLIQRCEQRLCSLTGYTPGVKVREKFGIWGFNLFNMNTLVAYLLLCW